VLKSDPEEWQDKKEWRADLERNTSHMQILGLTDSNTYTLPSLRATHLFSHD
jgi:hypothetical protein